MNSYRAPVREMRFVMDEIAGLSEIAALPGFEEVTPDLADAVLEEAARFTGEVLAPLNRIGDQAGCTLTYSGSGLPRDNRRDRDSSPRSIGKPQEIPLAGQRGQYGLGRFRGARAGSRAPCDQTPAIHPETGCLDGRD